MKLTVKNDTTGEEFTTDSLEEAQAFRDAHEGELVAIWSGKALVGESSARFAARREDADDELEELRDEGYRAGKAVRS